MSEEKKKKKRQWIFCCKKPQKGGKPIQPLAVWQVCNVAELFSLLALTQVSCERSVCVCVSPAWHLQSDVEAQVRAHIMRSVLIRNRFGGCVRVTRSRNHRTITGADASTRNQGSFCLCPVLTFSLELISQMCEIVLYIWSLLLLFFTPMMHSCPIFTSSL